MRLARRILWLGLLLVLAGCQGKLYSYTDPEAKVSISYPGNFNLTADKETLKKATDPADSEGAVDAPQLLFVLTTPEDSRISCSLYKLPAPGAMTAQEYYDASTARELEGLGAQIVEPKTDLRINGRTFQMVGFLLKVDEATTLHVRIYQHLDDKTGKIVVLTPMVDVQKWDSEIAMIEPVVNSLKVDW